MTAPERIRIELTREQAEGAMAGLDEGMLHFRRGIKKRQMTGANRRYYEALLNMYDAIAEQFWAQQGAGDATVDEDALHIWDGEDA